jgi:hypothetical protein
MPSSDLTPLGAQAPGAAPAATSAPNPAHFSAYADKTREVEGAPAAAGGEAQAPAPATAQGPAEDSAQPHALAKDPREEKKRKRRGIILLFLCVILGAAATLGVGLWWLYRSGYGAKPVASGIALSSGDVAVDKAEINALTEASRLWVSAASELTSDDGVHVYALGSTGQAIGVVNNIDKNTRALAYTVTLASTGETLYESGLLWPGECLLEIELARALEPGTHDLVIEGQGYTMEERATAVGASVSAQVVLEVTA